MILKIHNQQYFKIYKLHFISIINNSNYIELFLNWEEYIDS